MEVSPPRRIREGAEGACRLRLGKSAKRLALDTRIEVPLFGRRSSYEDFAQWCVGQHFRVGIELNGVDLADLATRRLLSKPWYPINRDGAQAGDLGIEIEAKLDALILKPLKSIQPMVGVGHLFVPAWLRPWKMSSEKTCFER